MERRWDAADLGPDHGTPVAPEAAPTSIIFWNRAGVLRGERAGGDAPKNGARVEGLSQSAHQRTSPADEARARRARSPAAGRGERHANVGSARHRLAELMPHVPEAALRGRCGCAPATLLLGRRALLRVCRVNTTSLEL